MQTFEEFWSDVNEYQLESVLAYPEFKKNIKYANGCGSKGGIKVPDTMWLLCVIAACIIHDMEWQLAKNLKDLVAANERFDNNLKLIIDKDSNWFMRPIRRMRIAKYVSGVELYGTEAYAKDRGFI